MWKYTVDLGHVIQLGYSADWREQPHPVSFANRPVVGEILPVDICTFCHLFSFVENEMSNCINVCDMYSTLWLHAQVFLCQ